MVRFAIAALVLASTTQVADAFCGFYVSGSGSKMFNDATQVVLVRDGTRTVLSMQNDYKGPLEDFAMVVPVPVVLKRQDVATLKKDVFDRVDAMGAPRLVEYWEEDPCFDENVDYSIYGGLLGSEMGSMDGGLYLLGTSKSTVKVEAKFDVAEYQIVILSATEAAGLETWLTANKYKIPDGAAPLLRPYVEAGSKFFVAKVNPEKVEMREGRAALSPLRFHYESEDFSLPIRLGLASSSGKQDLIVNIISPDTRYEVANYKNVFVPTNIDVKSSVKTRFAEFYAALFDQTLAANPRAVVTEYAWTAQNGVKCDPCPDNEMTNGDVVQLAGPAVKIGASYVMTRLHARYGAKDMKDDLRFRAAKPVTGGREEYTKNGIEIGATEGAKENFFQARYAIRHWWSGKIECKNPKRRVWTGSPPNGGGGGFGGSAITAQKVAFAPRGKLKLANVIHRDIWEIGYKKQRKAAMPVKGAAVGVTTVLLLFGLYTLRRRRQA